MLFDRMAIINSASRLANGEYAKQILETTYGRPFINCPAGVSCIQNHVKKYLNGDIITIANKKISKPYLLITNRHMPDKKIEWGIEAISRVSRSRADRRLESSNFKLVITGDETPHTIKLKLLTKKLRIEDRVIFTELVNEKDLDVLYENAYLYLYTAPEEDFGMGIIEALYHGIPVVCWNYAGPSYIISNKYNGYLVKPYDIDSFSKNINKLLSDKKLYKEISRNAKLYGKSYDSKNHGKILLKEINYLYEKFQISIKK